MEPDRGFEPTLQLWIENVDYEAATLPSEPSQLFNHLLRPGWGLLIDSEILPICIDFQPTFQENNKKFMLVTERAKNNFLRMLSKRWKVARMTKLIFSNKMELFLIKFFTFRDKFLEPRNQSKWINNLHLADVTHIQVLQFLNK